jgi:hypothetical protein
VVVAAIVVGILVVGSRVIGPAVDCSEVVVAAIVVGILVVGSSVVGPAVDCSAVVVAAFVYGNLVVGSSVFGPAADCSARGRINLSEFDALVRGSVPQSTANGLPALAELMTAFAESVAEPPSQSVVPLFGSAHKPIKMEGSEDVTTAVVVEDATKEGSQDEPETGVKFEGELYKVEWDGNRSPAMGELTIVDVNAVVGGRVLLSNGYKFFNPKAPESEVPAGEPPKASESDVPAGEPPKASESDVPADEPTQ